MPSAASVQEQSFWGNLDRRIKTEWAIITVLLMALTAALSFFGSHIGLSRIENTFYDRALALSLDTPDDSDIVIIAIDDSSIERLGYWPWRRALHAQLLDKLHGAKVVGMDIVFNDTNPAYPEDDARMAESIARHGKVVLPTFISQDASEVYRPLPVLAAAAKNMGYINVYPSGDGVVRSLQPALTLADGRTQRYFVAAMLAAAGNKEAYARLSAHGNTSLLIPYSGNPGHFRIAPYAGVLSGEIPAETFKDKYVLVGSWGSGLGDAFPTPLSRDGEPMAGIEIMANGLLSALNDQWILTPKPWQLALLASLPVLLSCLAIHRLSPRRSFVMTMAVLFAIIFVSWGLMRYFLVWVPVTASLIGVALAYPIWNWRSQEVALQNIDQELLTLDHQRMALYSADSLTASGRRDSSLPARISQLHSAISQLRDAQHKREETLRFLSHDMRSPQNSILALTQLQRKAQAALSTEDVLDRIDQYANKTLVLVDGFIQFARADAAQLSQNTINLAELLTQCADDFWAQAQRRHIRIIGKDGPDPAWVTGDSTMLTRVFCNLLDNALKYSPDHTLISWSIESGHNAWTVRISDQGRGMSPDQLNSLFVPFTRLDEDMPGNASGAGLGLAFVETVIKRHGGTVRAESEKNMGSTFIVTLPVSAG